MKLLILSDLHMSKETWPVVSKILDYAKEKANEINPDFICMPGDIFDHAIQNSRAHFIDKFKNKMDDLSDVAHIILIYGTQNHDAAGSLEFLKSFKISIAEPEKPLIVDNTVFYCIPDSRPWEVIDEKNPNKAGQGINEYLRSLCLTYGANRKSNPEMNAVVLGHGIVKNVKNKNNIIIEKATVYLDESNLAKIDADVSLYGHTHNGYEFETIPGKALTACQAHTWKDVNYYPAIHEYELEPTVNKKGNIRFYKEHRIPFIPRRQKISNYLKNPIPMNEFDGDLIHVEKDKNNSVTKEDLIAAGAHPDSFITIKPEITHIIRDTEIITATTRRKEYELYWKQQGKIAQEEELLECDKIQNMEAKEGVVPFKRTIEPLFTHVRGFTPLWVGMQKEEIYIDWTNYKPGILGFMGKGGLGKTNLLGLILPHTENLTNESKTSSMFMLPDSFAIRGYKVNDNIVICKVFYGDKKTEYQVFINNELIDAYSGSLSKYENYVDSLFGTPRMCALSMFQSQWPLEKTYGGQKINPNIKIANNSELKSIFTELLNIDRSFAYNYSKKQFDEFSGIVKSKILELEGFKKAIDNPNELNVKILELQNNIEVIDNELLLLYETITGLEDAKKVLNDKNQLSQTAEQVVKLHQGNIVKDKTEIELQNSYKNYTGESIEDIQKEIDKLLEQEKDNDIKRKANEEKQKIYNLQLSEYTKDTKIYTGKLADYEKKKQGIINLMNERNFNLKNKHQENLVLYSNKYKAFREKQAQFEQNKNRLSIELNTCVNIASGFVKDIDSLNYKIESLNKPCYKCGAIDPGNIKQIAQLNIDKKGIEIKHSVSLNEYELKKKKLKDYIFTETEPSEPIEPEYEKVENLAELKTFVFAETEPTMPTNPIIDPIDETIQGKIDDLINKKENTITMDQKAAAADQVIEKLNKEIITLETLIKSESEKIVLDINKQISDNETNITNYDNQLKDKTKQYNKYKSDINSLNDRIKEIEKKQEQLKIYELEIEKLNGTVALWSNMMIAWGRDGIPAMILENAAPEIDQEVNSLLEKYYPKLVIQTSTLRDKADGKSKIEDFNINLIDTQTGKTYPLHGLSGEQGNFALTAIREACNKIRERTANIKYNFAVMDEPDSWVSEDLLSAFWEMINDVNKDRNRLIICVSHSPVAKDLFEQKVNIEDLMPS